MASKSLTFNLFGNDKTATKAIRGVGKETDVLGKAFIRLGSIIASAFAFERVFTGLKQTIGIASDLQEAGTAISAVFGSSAAGIQEWAASAATSFGSSTVAALKAAQTFGVYGNAAGLAGDANQQFATGLVELGADLASFYNSTPEDAIEALGAGLRGEAEPLRRFGILLDDATLRATALRMGVYNGNGALTQQQRILAANTAIFEQATVAVGDFGRTQGGLANQQRIAAAMWTNISGKIGELFLPAALAASSALTSSLLPALESLVERVGPEVRSFFEGAGETAGRFAVALSSALELGTSAPLLNLFQDLAKVSPVFSILAAGIETLGPVLPVLADAFAELGKTLTQEGVLESLSELVVALLPPLADLLVAVAPLIPPIADLLTTVLVPALQLAAGNIGMISIALAALKGDLSPEGFIKAVEALPVVGDAFKFLGDTIVNVQNSIANALNGLIAAIEGAVNGARMLVGLGSITLPRVGLASTAAFRGTPGGGGRRATAFAEGGLVRATPGGTLGVVGEAGHDEAVIPMTPQVMREIGAGFAQAAGGMGGATINVYSDDPWTAARLVANRLGGGMAVLRG